jgi:hypothetical protein
MYEFVDSILERRRFIYAGISVMVVLLLSSLLGSTIQAHRATIEARIHASSDSQSSPMTDESPNVVTNAMAAAADGIRRVSDAAEVNVLSGTMLVATGLTRFNIDMQHAAITVALFTYHVGFRAVTSVFHFASAMLHASTGATSNGFVYIAQSVVNIFSFNVHMVGDVGSFAYGLTRVNSVIQPADTTPIPTITELRAQQAAIIQKGTEDVSIAALTSGSGGACDSGDGNGGYPMSWCNAPMDTVSTVGYTSDAINRECTSYAYWYFAAVEGHADFRVFDDARYWTSTSNYPSHATPVVGGIAVETAGAYGHVAIVQALPGQKYAGQVVPAGYLLVSEMNYDWGGHFRYSYSPIGKFSAYIY